MCKYSMNKNQPMINSMMLYLFGDNSEILLFQLTELLKIF